MANEVLSYIRVLVWPSLVIGVVFFFRGQIGQLILRLKSLPTPWGQAEFGAETAQIADQAASIEDRVVPKLGAGARVAARAAPVVPADPTVAFLDAYNGLEAVARDVAGQLQMARWQPVAVVRELAMQQKIPEDTLSLAERLREIRNAVVHGALRLQGPDAANLIEAVHSLADIVQFAR